MKEAQSNEDRDRGTGSMRVVILLIPLLALAACSSPPRSSRPHSPTQYLRSADAAPAPDRNEASRISPRTSARTPPSPILPSPPEDDPLHAQRAALIDRIEGLSRDECNSVSLRLELVPREEILEPESNPRKRLIRYARQATSREVLKSIELTINDRR